MKGNIDNELTNAVRRKIEKKFIIDRIEKFLLPIEESQRSILIIRKK